MRLIELKSHLGIHYYVLFTCTKNKGFKDTNLSFRLLYYVIDRAEISPGNTLLYSFTENQGF